MRMDRANRRTWVGHLRGGRAGSRWSPVAPSLHLTVTEWGLAYTRGQSRGPWLGSGECLNSRDPGQTGREDKSKDCLVC